MSRKDSKSVKKPSTRKANSSRVVKSGPATRKKKLALLLPGHNERLIIQSTIKAAMAAGQAKEDIYVVDDGSTDRTRKEAMATLGYKQVLTVKRCGKAEAVIKAIKRFKIEQRYTWVHVADSDSVFGEDYFNIYRRALKGKKYVVAVGFVQSLRGNWIAHYRSFTYTYSQHIIRRFQSWFNMIAVFPGPITSFRTSIIKDLDFKNHSLTEDFDITLQVHRKKLGKIKYIPEAVNYTQDPKTLKDFCAQSARWQRGFFHGVKKYKVGRRLQPIDISIGYQMLELSLYIFQIVFLIPYVVITTHSFVIVPVIFISDLFVICLLAFLSALTIKRTSPISALPYYYFLRWLELGIFIKAFFEVVLLNKYQDNRRGWKTERRRFSLDSNALKDIAK